MNERAFCAGELAFRIVAGRKRGRVTRVFQKSAYLRSGNDFALLLWGGLKSPMTVNIEGEAAGHRPLRAGQECIFDQEGIQVGETSIELHGAEVYRSSLTERRGVSFATSRDLVKGVSMLKSLYNVSAAGSSLPTDKAFRTFVSRVLEPLSAGESRMTHRPESYLPLVGRGEGFTPAGDDFVGGFLASYNCIARWRRSAQIFIPRAMLFSRTIPESAAIIGYSSRGHVDEAMENLILKTLGGKRFFDELLVVARRGHTSGIDMSLGVLLCEAAVSDSTRGGGSLKACTETFWNT